jgi:hypothetical protein
MPPAAPRPATPPRPGQRAYRQQASVFHPDKHAGDELRGKAQEAFARLQVRTTVALGPTATAPAGAGSGLRAGRRLWRPYLLGSTAHEAHGKQ